MGAYAKDEEKPSRRWTRRSSIILSLAILAAILAGGITSVGLLVTRSDSGATASSTELSQLESSMEPKASTARPQFPSRKGGEIDVECPVGRFGYNVDTVRLGSESAYSSFRDVTASGTFTNGTTAAVKFDFDTPVLEIGLEDVPIDFVGYSRVVEAGETVSWSADDSIYSPSYASDADLELWDWNWDWEDPLLMHCSKVGVGWY